MHNINITDFPQSYYFRAGFWMFFGKLWAGLVLGLIIGLAFALLVFLGVFSAGFLHALGGLR
jgi:hypothetical protein